MLRKIVPHFLISIAAIASIATSVETLSDTQFLSVGGPLAGSVSKEFKLESRWMGEGEPRWFSQVFADVAIVSSTTAVASSTVAPRVRVILARNDVSLGMLAQSMDVSQAPANDSPIIIVQDAVLTDFRLEMSAHLSLFTDCEGSCDGNFHLIVMQTNADTAPPVQFSADLTAETTCFDGCDFPDTSNLEVRFFEVE